MTKIYHLDSGAYLFTSDSFRAFYDIHGKLIKTIWSQSIPPFYLPVELWGEVSHTECICAMQKRLDNIQN